MLALANFDTPVGLPEELSATWPFWLVLLLVVGVMIAALRRLGPGPGWPSFFVGFVAPLIGLVLNARLGGGGGLWFWLPIAVLVLAPLPRMGVKAP